MRRRVRTFWDLLIEAGIQFSEEHVTKLSASLAYFTIFSIGPLLLVIITILGFIYRRATVTTQVFEQVSSVIGTSATNELQHILNSMSMQNNTTLIGIIGALVFVFGATGIFSEIQSSINFIWSIKAKPKRGWLKYLKDRLISLLLVIGMGALMLVTIIANIIIDLISGRLEPYMGNANTLLIKASNFALLFVIVVLVFFVIFKVLPDARIHWKDALVGAIFTGILFLIGKFLISYYLGKSKNLNIYGAATSIILVLSWVYYSAMILYYGAEFTEVYAKKHGRGIRPNRSAVHVVKHETDILDENGHPTKVGKK